MSLSTSLKYDRALKSLKVKAKESRERRQQVPIKTENKKRVVLISNQHLLLISSCILILLSYLQQWKCRLVITQGHYHFQQKQLLHLFNLLEIFHEVCKIVLFITTKVTLIWVFFCNSSGESERQHISYREYCNINPIQQSTEIVFSAVHCSFVAMSLEISLPNHACILKYEKVILLPMKQHNTYTLGSFLTFTVFESIPYLGIRMSH